MSLINGVILVETKLDGLRDSLKASEAEKEQVRVMTAMVVTSLAD